MCMYDIRDICLVKTDFRTWRAHNGQQFTRLDDSRDITKKHALLLGHLYSSKD